MTGDPTTSLEPYRARIDGRLDALVPKVLSRHAALDRALRDAILAPGKRLRPLMTVVAAEDLGGPSGPAVDAGCAVEMVHAASLVLDDLPCMDDATLRRGRPAIHVGHGEDLAVLVSIGMLGGAYEILAGIEGLSPSARLEAVAILSRAVGVAGLVGGQFDDLRGGRRGRPLAEVAATNGLKTGSLFTAAVEIGAVAAGARAEDRARLRLFGEEIGHAFQLIDDLLDGSGSAASIGKDVGKDANKSTIVAMLGPATARQRIARHLDAASAELGKVFGPGSRLEALTRAIWEQSLPAAAEHPEGGAGAEGERPPRGAGQEVGAR